MSKIEQLVCVTEADCGTRLNISDDLVADERPLAIIEAEKCNMRTLKEAIRWIRLSKVMVKGAAMQNHSITMRHVKRYFAVFYSRPSISSIKCSM